MFEDFIRPYESTAYLLVSLTHSQLSLSLLKSCASHIFKNVGSIFTWFLGLTGAFEHIRGRIVIWIRTLRRVSFIDGVKMLLSWVRKFLLGAHAAITRYRRVSLPAAVVLLRKLRLTCGNAGTRVVFWRFFADRLNQDDLPIITLTNFRGDSRSLPIAGQAILFWGLFNCLKRAISVTCESGRPIDTIALTSSHDDQAHRWVTILIELSIAHRFCVCVVFWTILNHVNLALCPVALVYVHNREVVWLMGAWPYSRSWVADREDLEDLSQVRRRGVFFLA